MIPMWLFFRDLAFVVLGADGSAPRCADVERIGDAAYAEYAAS